MEDEPRTMRLPTSVPLPWAVALACLIGGVGAGGGSLYDPRSSQLDTIEESVSKLSEIADKVANLDSIEERVQETSRDLKEIKGSVSSMGTEIERLKQREKQVDDRLGRISYVLEATKSNVRTVRQVTETLHNTDIRQTDVDGVSLE